MRWRVGGEEGREERVVDARPAEPDLLEGDERRQEPLGRRTTALGAVLAADWVLEEEPEPAQRAREHWLLADLVAPESGEHRAARARVVYEDDLAQLEVGEAVAALGVARRRAAEEPPQLVGAA